MKTLPLLVLLLAPLVASAQFTRQDSIWLPMKSFIGKWAGEGDGQPGKGKYERTYEPVLNKRFIEVKNKSTYAPTTKYPKGEVHEDHGFISYDRNRKAFVLRQFHVEGFVNQFRVESSSLDDQTIVFISENLENIPDGYRARETYQFSSINEFTETFEIAEPGKEFEVYSRVVLKRVKY